MKINYNIFLTFVVIATNGVLLPMFVHGRAIISSDNHVSVQVNPSTQTIALGYHFLILEVNQRELFFESTTAMHDIAMAFQILYNQLFEINCPQYSDTTFLSPFSSTSNGRNENVKNKLRPSRHSQRQSVSESQQVSERDRLTTTTTSTTSTTPTLSWVDQATTSRDPTTTSRDQSTSLRASAYGLPLLEMSSVDIFVDTIPSFSNSPQTIDASISGITLTLQPTVSCRGIFCNAFQNDESNHLFSSRRIPLSFVSDPSISDCLPTEIIFIQELQQIINDMIIESTIIDLVPMIYDQETCGTQDEPIPDTNFEDSMYIGVVGDISQSNDMEQMNLLEQAVVETYNQVNALNPNICDEYGRIVSSAIGLALDEDGNEFGNGNERRQLQSSGFNFVLFYRYLGSCKGCPSDGCLLNDSSNNVCRLRRRSRTLQSNNNEQRDLTFNNNDDSIGCYCSKFLANTNDAMYTLPTAEEFKLKLNERIQLLQEQHGLTFVTQVRFATQDTSMFNNCCKYPSSAFLPVPAFVYDENMGSDLVPFSIQQAINDYMDDPLSSPYGYPINCWDVSQVTNIDFAFSYHEDFNEPLNCWDTSNVNSMMGAFLNAHSFNQDINPWDVSSVEIMSYALYGMSVFNLPLDLWNTTNLVSMDSMFKFSYSFNQDISSWNTEKVTDFQHMFFAAQAFNISGIANWNVSNGIYMNHMFASAISFNVDLSGWDTRRVQDFTFMFEAAGKFNRDLCSWQSSNNHLNSSMYENMFRATACEYQESAGNGYFCFECD